MRHPDKKVVERLLIYPRVILCQHTWFFMPRTTPLPNYFPFNAAKSLPAEAYEEVPLNPNLIGYNSITDKHPYHMQGCKPTRLA
ncbi:hypothetical protein DSO57_1024236 [Entomophthora muscae]|uniref:Uncharacterized protein n=1 Tax=Entomophthora muscae TaxID=34485 RepID=A0ACC2UDG5_9FUNG|nr:hypothetical protein DSO57_1024236 [Entomophthora muscae]